MFQEGGDISRNGAKLAKERQKNVERLKAGGERFFGMGNRGNPKFMNGILLKPLQYLPGLLVYNVNTNICVEEIFHFNNGSLTWVSPG